MRKALIALLVSLAAANAGSGVAADRWPARTLTIVAPGPAGGTSDIFARLVADGLAKDLGQAVIVENRAGVGTLLGSQHVAHAKPDGHTLLMGAAALAIGPHVYRATTLDPVCDLVPIRVVARFPNVVVVNAAGPIRNVTDLLNTVRANPGKFNYASGGVGISEHLAGELFKSMTGADILHVPYKGSSDAALAVVTGDALVDFGNLAPVMPHVMAGKLRAIAVTSAARSSALPDVPTLAESGVIGYEVASWFGLFAPKGTPEEVIRALDAATRRVLASPEAQVRLRGLGAEMADDGPKEFGELFRAEHRKWGAVVRNANIRAD